MQLRILLSKTARAWGDRGSLAQIGDLLERPGAVRAVLALILLCAALLRFNGLNWDSNQLLHPDERFLAAVTNDLRWPSPLGTYFDPQTSTLSPYSLPDMGLYVYGTLPAYLVKLAATLLGRSSDEALSLVGRATSALFDLGTICFVFLIGRRLYGNKVGLLGAGLLSLSVLNIQLAHFYAVDTFACFFVVATIDATLRASSSGRWPTYALAGVLFGLGLACKVSVATLGVPLALGGALELARRLRGGEDARRALALTLARVLAVFAIAALVFRVVQPIAFAGPGFWNWSLNPRWLADIDEQRLIVAGDEDLPWLLQWTGRTPLFALYNILVWGLGLPLGLAAMAGLALAAYELARRRQLAHLLPLAYVAVTFSYHAAAFAKFMRYFLPIYPFLALLAAYLVAQLWRWASPSETHEAAQPAWPPALARLRPTRRAAGCLAGAVAGGTLLYALAFSTIYVRPHTRVAASQWMFDNIAPGATLANEDWDDWLPLDLVDGQPAFGKNGLFQAIQIPNYDDDTPAKLGQLVDDLSRADYVVISSNRGYDSIPRLPIRYPMTTRYYALLFGGRLGFERVAEFSSYPTLFGLQIPDQAAEEAFSVYDHPRVQIFKKTAAFDPAQVRRLLGDGIDWDAVLWLSPRGAGAAPTGLMLSPAEWRRYQQAAQWSSAGVSEGSAGSQAPVLAWFLALQALGLLALAPTLLACQHLADRGYIFSKAIGLLLAGWGAWVLASARAAPFTGATIAAVIAALAFVSWLLLRARRAELLAFVRARWRLLLLEELLFWGAFALALAIRWRNPDLWHPSMGGEKPMALAYLTAIVRTPYFPAYDPWFSGGYLNYSYFGYVLVATLIHLTGVAPTIAYNLAVPTLFAMTALGGFVAALNLAEGWQRAAAQNAPARIGVGRAALVAGLLGLLFVALIGNLGQARLLWDGLRNLSGIKGEGNLSPLVMLQQFADGLLRWRGGRPLGFRPEWWYWNATRIIPASPGEARPITEMPAFTFLFGDLDAHAMGLPYTLLALGLALNIIREPAQPGEAASWRLSLAEWLTLGGLALTLGALWPINAWDAPTYAALAVAALVCREFARRTRLDAQGVWRVLWQAALLLAAGHVLFLPFHQRYASDNVGVELWQGSHTPLWAYLLIHGSFLFVIASYLLLELARGAGNNALVRALSLVLRRPRRVLRLRRLFGRLVRPTPRYHIAVLATQAILVAALIVTLLDRVLGLALALIVLTALLLPRRRPDPRRQFALCMIGLGLALTAMVELVVAKGDTGRMNTVFKLYLQAWVLWGVSAAALLPQIARWLGTSAGASTTAASEASAPAWRWAVRCWWLASGLLLAACALYPLTAVPARVGDRFRGGHAATLDGAAYMRTAVYDDGGRQVQLDWDRQAIEWLRHNAAPMATIVEASTPRHRWRARVSVYSGLPSVIGWDWNQKQQRSILLGSAIDQRIEDVRTIYTSTDAALAERLLARYGVRYIYLGPLERIYYAGDGLKKFEQPGRSWSLVYQNAQVQIYAVH